MELLVLYNKKRDAGIDTPFLSDLETLMKPVPLTNFKRGTEKCCISGLKTGPKIIHSQK